MPKQREEILNAELGRLLIEKHPSWNERNVHIDSTDTVRDNPGLKIDVLVENPGGQPVAIETKFNRSKVGTDLREQVDNRIGLQSDLSGHVIESGISVVYPKGTTGSRVSSTKLRYAIHQLQENDRISRWPSRDDEWLEGSVLDLADAVESVSLSERRVRAGEKLLSDGVKDISAQLSVKGTVASLNERLAQVLHQASGEQTTRMAVAILINAFVFHYAIEGQSGIPDVSTGRGSLGFRKSKVLTGWDAILNVNYWPIFSISKDILEVIPASLANDLLDAVSDLAEELVGVGATTFHDLAARMFQTLITDRKFLATFYTLPESACLLAELAVSQLHVDWSNREQIENLKIADFACGTGTLLSAVQRCVYQKLRREGLNDSTSHRSFMERVLLGTDIMPSAAHLTASMLSSAHPKEGYENSLVRILPYGIDQDLSKLRGVKTDTAYLGALDLTHDEFGHSLYTAGGEGPQVEIGGSGMSPNAQSSSKDGRDFPVEHNSFDLVIMNPPFTRPTGHEAAKVGVPIPSFAGFDTTEDEQRTMSRKLKLTTQVFGHGNAGLPSNFLDLAHMKLKTNGVLAVVLPFAFVSGKSWLKARDALSTWYEDIRIVSIATSGTNSRSFSADTGMAECLVVATRTDVPHTDKHSATIKYSNLLRRPQSNLEAQEVAKGIKNGAFLSGTFLDAGLAGIRDSDLGNVVKALRKGEFKPPRSTSVHRIPITTLQNIADRGKYHMDINGANGRGAFDIKNDKKRRIETWPVLWRHDANRERQLIVEPDSYGVVRTGMDVKARNIWDATASRLHHNVDFRLNSQSLAACLTIEPCIGGTAWPNLIANDDDHTIPLLLWLNTTMGLMLYWWYGVRQQQGRARLKITALPQLPTLDLRKLKPKQIGEISEIHTELLGRFFLPANEAYQDQTRKYLDRRLLRVLLVPESLIDAFDLVRLKWCSEPSVHGGKSTGPNVRLD